jgi:asparagine synthase (glutamine-hydrolysing)
MCGIFCIYSRNGFSFENKQIIDTYIENGKLLNHRGDTNNYKIINNKLFIFHNRLAINDLSSKGTQPMIKDQIMVLVNGEIYNYNELVKLVNDKLPNYIFKSTSDSEILIPLYLLYGSAFINKLNGMYSFVLYDLKKNIILCARDHIGITSLYYSETPNIIMFSSEMKALVNITDNIKIFEPGMMYINRSFFTHYSPKWKQIDYIPNTKVDYSKIKDILINSVLKHTLSDQPIGILLSGGLDSSIIASIMTYLKRNKLINNPIKTFTIGLENADDIIAANKVADFIKSDHTAYNFYIENAIDILETVIYHIETYDITTIRASIPLYLLSKQIKEDTDIKVILSGEGADELMAGYLYFHKAPNKEELQKELVDKISLLHKYDCLRAHKATMANTIELRVPFLDKTVVDYLMDIDPQFKMIDKNKENNIEKYILRKSFDNDTFLPKDILYRTKAQFSDAVSSKKENLIDSLKEYAEKQINDIDFKNKENIFPINTPITKEGFLYRKIFESKFKHISCIKTVDHNIKSISCSTERALKWLNIDQNSNINDPSGNVMLDLI